MIRLSVVVPFCNAAPYIERCLRALQNQGIDPSEFEIIAVDDGSTDNGLRIVQHLSGEYPNIRAISQPNQGPAAARNRGFRQSRGAYVHFVDADDYLLPLVYRAALPACEQKGLEVLSIGCSRQAHARNVPTARASGDMLGPVVDFVDYVSRYRYENEAWAYIWERSLVEQGKGPFLPERRYLEDCRFVLDALSRAKRIAHLDLEAYVHYDNPGSLINSQAASDRRRTIEGFLFNIDYMDDFIAGQSARGISEARFFERLYARRDSYVFFLLLRLLRGHAAADETREILSKLQSKGIYPIRRFIGRDFNRWIYRPILRFMNQPGVFLAACRLSNRLAGRRGSATF